MIKRAKRAIGAGSSRGAETRPGQRVVIAAFGFPALIWLTAPAASSPGTFVWNYTPSVPVGLYRVSSSVWSRGDYVAIKPSPMLADTLAKAGALERGRLLLKRIAASAGDVVCRDDLSVSINGTAVALARAEDATGAALPAWSGCQVLSPRDVFLLGDHAASFDARYFGPTAAADIVGSIQPVVIFGD